MKGAAAGCGDALQVSCLRGFDTLGLHQIAGGSERLGSHPLPHHSGEADEPWTNQVALAGVSPKSQGGAKLARATCLKTASGPAPYGELAERLNAPALSPGEPGPTAIMAS